MQSDQEKDFSDRMLVLENANDSSSFSMERPGEGAEEEAADPFDLGHKRGWMPILGERTWEVSEADERAGYYAYIFRHGNREVGYIRIPHFTRNSAGLEQFRQVIQLFEARTKEMVLDIVDNPGGSMFFMYALASMLTDRNLPLPRHSVVLTEDDVAVAEDVLANSDDELPERVNYSRVILEEFKAGRWGSSDRGSYPLYLGGISEITPSKVRYTGKVLVLVNEVTFSAGEFLAAIFKDNDLHTIFGTCTAGAGGCAKKEPIHSSLFPGMILTVRWTLAHRTNGELIEKFGVEPDISYSPTIEDLRSKDPLRTEDSRWSISGYQEYRHALLEVIDSLHLNSQLLNRAAAIEKTVTPEQLQAVLNNHKTWRQEWTGGNLTREGCQRAILQGFMLANVDLRGADLSFANLSEANLQGANLRDASLAWSNLRGANLEGADLRGADLQCAYLADANLSGAKLAGGNIQPLT
jgi:hypothetical protein